MKMFYSGMTVPGSLPEEELKDAGAERPCVMLTYHEIHERCSTTLKRMERHAYRRRRKAKRKRTQ